MALTNEDLQAIAQLMDSKLKPLSDDIQSIKTDVTGIKLVLENEICVNIQRVAESLVLSEIYRKL